MFGEEALAVVTGINISSQMGDIGRFHQILSAPENSTGRDAAS